jgi:hypothetical protein
MQAHQIQAHQVPDRRLRERSRGPSLGPPERADPADPGGMGSTGPAIEDGAEITLGHRRIRATSAE